MKVHVVVVRQSQEFRGAASWLDLTAETAITNSQNSSHNLGVLANNGQKMCIGQAETGKHLYSKQSMKQ